MFYSHEILCNSQYGVATIWLAATVAKGNAVGKGGLRPLTRKAVQEVNVPKACATIIDPGAPLALRLQSSLLFGVSRVFAQQCTYVLSDAEKIQSDMMTFFRVLQTSELDPQAGKTKRHNIVLEDDPSFDLFNALPNLDSLRGSVDNLFGVPSQGSTNKYSQMTPRRQSQSSLSSLSNPALLPFDLPSSLCAGSFHLPSEFGHQNSPLAGKSREQDNMPEFMPFGDDDLDPIPNVSLDFDGDGNLLGIFDQEPELPPLPEFPGDELQLDQGNAGVVGEPEVQPLPAAGGDPEFGMGEGALPNDGPSVARLATEQPTESYAKTSQTTETEEVSAHNRRIRRKPFSMIDETAHIPRQDIRNWDANYAETMGRETSRKRLKTVNQTQARKNALALIYGNRIANVGLVQGINGITHPLAEEFAGRTLEAHLHGLDPLDLEPDAVKQRGRRRKSPEAFVEETAEEEGHRNVRPRIEEDAELGRGNMNDDGEAMIFADDTAPEMGLDPAVPLEERHSSSIMPWLRSASVAHGHGSTQKPAPSPSPLHGRGSVLGSIERRSDAADHAFEPAGMGSADSSIDFRGDISALDFNRGNDTQASHADGLDIASQEFLTYATAQAVEKGTTRDADNDDGSDDERRWVSFEDLARPGSHSKGIAAQAFLHVLSLATKGVVAVQQDGTEEKQPFGTIHIGVPVQRAREESLDELL